MHNTYKHHFKTTLSHSRPDTFSWPRACSYPLEVGNQVSIFMEYESIVGILDCQVAIVRSGVLGYWGGANTHNPNQPSKVSGLRSYRMVGVPTFGSESHQVVGFGLLAVRGRSKTVHVF